MLKKLKIIETIAPPILSVIGCVIALYYKPLFIIPVDADFHFSLITVNALFGGFLYTNYSVLIGLSDKAIVDKVKNTSIIKKRNSHILRGILYSVISVLSGIYLVLNSGTIANRNDIIYSLMINVEICFMIFSIVYFLLSLYEMHTLVSATTSTVSKKSDEEIIKLKDQIKNHRSK